MECNEPICKEEKGRLIDIIHGASALQRAKQIGNAAMSSMVNKEKVIQMARHNSFQFQESDLTNSIYTYAINYKGGNMCSGAVAEFIKSALVEHGIEVGSIDGWDKQLQNFPDISTYSDLPGFITDPMTNKLDVDLIDRGPIVLQIPKGYIVFFEKFNPGEDQFCHVAISDGEGGIIGTNQSCVFGLKQTRVMDKIVSIGYLDDMEFIGKVHYASPFVVIDRLMPE